MRELGKGGGGVVYLAIDREGTLFKAISAFGVDVMVRAMQPGTSAAAEDAVPNLVIALLSVQNRDGVAALKVPKVADDRFKRELEAMEKYRHPALLRLIDRDRQQTPQWFVSEYHAQGSLADGQNVAKYRGRPLAALNDLRPVAEGLAKLHREGAVHRDVKPKNIFIASDGRLVLGDFGIIIPSVDAEAMTGLEPVHSRDWVPDWVQFGEERNYTPAVDVFAWAKILWFLISGRKVMASQIDEQLDGFGKQYPHASDSGPVLQLLRSYIVTKPKELEGKTAVVLLDDCVRSTAVRIDAAVNPRLQRGTRQPQVMRRLRRRVPRKATGILPSVYVEHAAHGIKVPGAPLPLGSRVAPSPPSGSRRR